MQGLKKSLTN